MIYKGGTMALSLIIYLFFPTCSFPNLFNYSELFSGLLIVSTLHQVSKTLIQKFVTKRMRTSKLFSDNPMVYYKPLRRRQINFCCAGPTDPNFRYIKIIMNSRIYAFVFTIYFSSNMIFFFSVSIKLIKSKI